MRKLSGYLIIISVNVITITLWLLAKKNGSTTDPTRALSQISALAGLVLMSMSLILTTRIRFIENLFGGLDKVYNIHRLIGSISFIFIINHPLLIAIQALPNFGISYLYLFPGQDLAYNFGVISLYTMILAFIFMIFIKLPYNLWKNIHQILAISFITGAIHTLLIKSDISSSFLLKIWTSGFILIGLLSMIYIIFFYKNLSRRFIYEVEKIERKLDIINIYLKPINKKIEFLPGQFGYISFLNQKIGTEDHPFSFSSAPQENLLRISVKLLGDYTLRLTDLDIGEKAVIYGPHGYFGKIYQDKKPQKLLLIAGGIGITPFLSTVRSELYQSSNYQIILYYCFKKPDEAVFLDELEDISNRKTNIKCVYWCTSEKTRLNSQIIKNEIGDFINCNIQICGPNIMMTSLKDQFMKEGVDEEDIHFEQFQFLS